jgi:hypothetical protein
MSAPGALSIRASTAMLVAFSLVATACKGARQEGVSGPAAGATITVVAPIRITAAWTPAARMGTRIEPAVVDSVAEVATPAVLPSTTATAQSVGFANVPLADLLARPGARFIFMEGAYQGPGTIMIADSGAGEQAELATVAEYGAASGNHDVDRDTGTVVFADRPKADGSSLWIVGLGGP